MTKALYSKTFDSFYLLCRLKCKFYSLKILSSAVAFKSNIPPINTLLKGCQWFQTSLVPPCLVTKPHYRALLNQFGAWQHPFSIYLYYMEENSRDIVQIFTFCVTQKKVIEHRNIIVFIAFDLCVLCQSSRRYTSMQEQRQKLPAWQMRDAILECLDKNQVLVISGMTG